MTEAAYETMLLVERARAGAALPSDISAALTALGGSSAMASFMQAIALAVPKLRALPSGLTPPQSSTCADQTTIAKLGTNTPNWNANGDFPNVPLGQVAFPVASDYFTGNDCGIDPNWAPSGVFADVNSQFPGGDHTGTVLGLWATGPDHEEDDIHMWFRLSNAGGFSFVKDFVATLLGGLAGTVWVPIQCLFTCLETAVTLGMSGDCAQCLEDAIADSQGAGKDVVKTVDGIFPGFGDHTAELYTGLSHHIDAVQVKPAGPWAVSLTPADDRIGLLVDRAGPVSIPDPIEFLAMLAADQTGMSVHYEPSLAPENYEIDTGADGHQASTHRGAADWQLLSWVHTPFTPLDNLGFFGWAEAEGFAGRGDFQTSVGVDPTQIAMRLGWLLHALGDASVPMHVTGTFGWGHAPYESAQSNLKNELLRQGSPRSSSRRWVTTSLLPKALAYRQAILNWRATHPGSLDVPVRDIITAVADKTFATALSKGPWVWDPFLSSMHIVAPEIATAAYDDVAQVPFYGELIDEGIAATIAVLTSTMEVMP